MFDIHMHLLPDMDDGPVEVEETREMLKVAYAEGISGIFATPHLMAYSDGLSYSFVEETIGELGLEGRVHPGLEVMVDEGVVKHCKKGIARGLGGGRYLLCELPMYQEDEESLNRILAIRDLGFEVILAHPERYPYIVKNPKGLNPFISAGCLFQVNAWSLVGNSTPGVRPFAEELARRGLLDFVGSDAHSMDHRPPGVMEALSLLEGFRPGLRESVVKNSESVFLKREILLEERVLFG